MASQWVLAAPRQPWARAPWAQKTAGSGCEQALRTKNGSDRRCKRTWTLRARRGRPGGRCDRPARAQRRLDHRLDRHHRFPRSGFWFSSTPACFPSHSYMASSVTCRQPVVCGSRTHTSDFGERSPAFPGACLTAICDRHPRTMGPGDYQFLGEVGDGHARAEADAHPRAANAVRSVMCTSRKPTWPLWSPTLVAWTANSATCSTSRLPSCRPKRHGCSSSCATCPTQRSSGCLCVGRRRGGVGSDVGRRGRSRSRSRSSWSPSRCSSGPPKRCTRVRAASPLRCAPAHADDASRQGTPEPGRGRAPSTSP